jgi:signal transduction histidine kinase
VSSLRARLFAVWVLSLVASVAIGALLVHLYGVSAQASRARADVLAAQACERIADRYGYYVTGWAGPSNAATLDPALRRDLLAVVATALGDTPGLQGGIWHDGEGIVASVPTLDLTNAEERAAIADASSAAVTDGAPARRVLSVSGIPEIVRACPLGGPIPALAAWARMPAGELPAVDPLLLGMAVLFALVLGIAALLAWMIADWNRKVQRVEAELASFSADPWPAVALTGEPSLDRIVAALNTAGARLAEAREKADAMGVRAAAAERLAALGRVAAGIAHEIRNPIAAMRLRAENALLGDSARQHAALKTVLAQVARLDHLLTDLLTMTQCRDPAPEEVDVPSFLAACAADAAAEGGPPIEVHSALTRARFDPDLVRRALSDLLGNACRHAGPGGSVSLAAARQTSWLRFAVADTGPGIDPALHHSLFDPFVTGRADGVGLGLAIARELAQAHGGMLRLADAGGANRKTVFELDLPWPAS